MMESQASKTPDKTTLGTSYAFSRKFNTRNLEYYWYPLWAQVLSDLVKAAPALLVAPQFYTWIPNPADDTSIEVEVEETEDGDDPDEFKVIEEIAQGPQDNLTTAEDESGAVDSLGTIPEKNSRGAIADFAIVHLSPRASSPGDSARYGGWKIDVASVKLIVEVKRSASRSLKGDLLDAEVIKIMKEATADLVKQAAYIFAADTETLQLRAIAAIGPYWSETTIRRDDVTCSMQCFLKANYRKEARKLAWSTPVRIGGTTSDERFKTICEEFNSM